MIMRAAPPNEEAHAARAGHRRPASPDEEAGAVPNDFLNASFKVAVRRLRRRALPGLSRQHADVAGFGLVAHSP